MNLALRTPLSAGGHQRRRLRVRGQVQGVGFRPHVYRTALALELHGWVRNDGDGVTIEIEGRDLERFAERLLAELPPLARVDSLCSESIAPLGESGFHIAASDSIAGQAVLPADAAICSSCLEELFNPDDRRYLHPFIACCDCGPRYSMARGMPYDRSNTAMADFDLCADCAQDYENPLGRRLHAEPIACHGCGPQLSHPVEVIAGALRDGAIVAIKGVGGYHLACNARDRSAVERLRRRKQRDGRPFAVMQLNTASAALEVRLDASCRRALTSIERPVVIMPRASGGSLPEALSPGLDTLGVLLPYTPLHYLLFHALLGTPQGRDWLVQPCDLALVMTSANRSGDPMLTDDAQAREILAEMADLVVSHSRTIEHGCDDSVLRAAGGETLMVRRGRGFAPGALAVGRAAAPVLALGAHLKNTVCALRDDRVFLSPHVGDLNSPGTQALMVRNARELLDDLRLAPQAIACDLHRDYASTRLGERLAEELDLPLVRVQHHHAHIAAIAAVHQHRGPLLGLALDGHGLGADGGNWGGELLLVDDASSRRLASLRPLALPGGDRAAREPWRLALAVAGELGRGEELRQRFSHWAQAEAVLGLAQSPACDETTAAGRYFDAAAALLGLCERAAFEAAAPMCLESHCRELRADAGLYRIDGNRLDLHALFERLLDCPDPARGSALFHGTLVEALVAWVLARAADTAIGTVALGGGCFLNAVLSRELPRRLREEGLTVLTAEGELSPGDGGISLGQAWVASCMLASGVDPQRAA